MRFRFIETHRAEFAVVTMCRVLSVSKAGYYAWRARPRSAREIATTELLRVMRDVHVASDRTYGSPRMHRELAAQGYACSENRVARLMRAARIRAKQRRRFRVTTDSAHAAPTAPNTLARRFTVDTSAGPNTVWVADITFVPTGEGWLYLAVVLDLHSRRVVGWAMHTSLEWALVGDALTMAITQRRPPPGLLHHSDRGLQYACENYRTLLSRNGMTASMSRASNCWDSEILIPILHARPAA
jgi:transposase InsO family protein